MQAKNLKENSLNKLNALKTIIQHLSSSNHSMYYEFREAFHRLFDANEGLFRSTQEESKGQSRPFTCYHHNAASIMVDQPFANPKYLKIAQSEKLCCMDSHMIHSDPANRFLPVMGQETETLEKFTKPSVARQPNAQRIPKPSVLGKPTPFSNSPEMRKTSARMVSQKSEILNDVDQNSFRLAPQRQMDCHAEIYTPGPDHSMFKWSLKQAVSSLGVKFRPVLHHMNSDQNQFKLGIQRPQHLNSSSSKLVPKGCSLSNQDSNISRHVLEYYYSTHHIAIAWDNSK
ncbi:hypothetical protein Tco_0489784 [Tanacetum coccineum]